MQNRALSDSKQLLGRQLSKDGTTYLLAILCRCVQDNSGYKKGTGQERGLKSPQKQGGVGNNHKIMEMAQKTASSYEYYAESEEELASPHPNGPGRTSPRGIPGQHVKTPVVSRKFKLQEASALP